MADIDEIFFQSSTRHTFCDQDEKQAFRDMFLDRYFLKHKDSFLSHLMTPDEQLDILLAASKIQQLWITSMMFHTFVVLPTFAKSIRRTYILMYQSHFEISDWAVS